MGSLVVLAQALGLGLAGCADAPLPPAEPMATARTAADDGDPWNLVPQSVDAVADVDLVALRASPWSSALVGGGFAADRERSRQAFGYDLFAEGERLVTVSAEAGAAPRQLTIVRGQFDPERVGAAALAANPGSKAGRWRQSPIWEGGGRAVALVTPRTIAEGDPDSVRGAIDAAWGIVPDAHSGPIGELRRALAADSGRPAAFVAVRVTDGLRARAEGFVELPPGLRSAAVRLDLADDLNLDATALLASAGEAGSAAAGWSLSLRAAGQQPLMRMLGVGSMLEAATIGAEGARVHAHLRVPAERREGLAEKLHLVLQALLDARR